MPKTSNDIIQERFKEQQKGTAVPFFGVCGLYSATEYERLVRIAQDMLTGTSRFLMAGVKNIDGNLDYITPNDLVQPFIHCDYHPDVPYEQLVFRRLEASRHFVRGLQLNVVPWITHDFTTLWQLLRHLHPGIKLMLQAHASIVERCSPRQLAVELAAQQVDYVLFDTSQSRGIGYDPIQMSTYIAAIQELNLPVQIVVSGGLNSSNVTTMFGPLLKQYPDLSCDAFSNLYHPTERHLLLPAVERYIATLCELLQQETMPTVT